MKIYMDVCCLNRPFDDLSYERIQFESDAVLAILSRCQTGMWTLVSSEIIELELMKMQNKNKLDKVRYLLSVSKTNLILNESVIHKSHEFQKRGLKSLDSLHLAIAHDVNVDVFLTTDDAFLRGALKLKINLTISNPINWFLEVLQNER